MVGVVFTVYDDFLLQMVVSMSKRRVATTTEELYALTYTLRERFIDLAKISNGVHFTNFFDFEEAHLQRRRYD